MVALHLFFRGAAAFDCNARCTHPGRSPGTCVVDRVCFLGALGHCMSPWERQEAVSPGAMNILQWSCARAQNEPPPLSHCGCAFSGDLSGIRSGIVATEISHRVPSASVLPTRACGYVVVTRGSFCADPRLSCAEPALLRGSEYSEQVLKFVRLSR